MRNLYSESEFEDSEPRFEALVTDDGPVYQYIYVISGSHQHVHVSCMCMSCVCVICTCMHQMCEPFLLVCDIHVHV